MCIRDRVFGYQHDQETTTFYDVSQEHWAKDEIAVAQARGYITGYPDGTFRPDVPVSRGELAAILATVKGQEKFPLYRYK